MSDGTVQVELSSTPVHYQDPKGHWRDIDLTVKPGVGPDAFANVSNRFKTHFGRSTDDLLRFDADDAEISLGAEPGKGAEKRDLTPAAKGAGVTYPDVFGSADVRYEVSPSGVKESILLASPADVAPTYTFTMDTRGLAVEQQDDGSIAFYAIPQKGSGSHPSFTMPAPVMTDASYLASPDADPTGGRSDAVTQEVETKGGRTTIAITPDAAWLSSADRKFPVVIDPTIVVAPDPGAAQDTSLSAASPDATDGTDPSIPVGLGGSHNAYRGLVQFDTTAIPAGTQIRSADLELHFNRIFASDAHTIPIDAHRVTAPWDESSATWNSMSTSFVSSPPYTQVQVDDTDSLSTSFEGPWKDYMVDGAVGDTMSATGPMTGADTFTWSARVPGAGNYKVAADYRPYSTRGTPTYAIVGPDPVSGADTTTSASVDQTSGSGIVWATLAASKYFAPGKTAQVTMTRQTGSTATSPVADAVRFTESAVQTKEKDQHDSWHSFAVTSAVQKWLNGTVPNYGFMLKATDDSLDGPVGGVYYQASEELYDGATASRPKLVVTYDEPGVTLNVPTRINASGAELSWEKYIDPTPSEDDDIVEYQVYRSRPEAGDYYATDNPAIKLVGTVPSDVTTFTDTTAEPSTAASSSVYNYWVVVRTVADVSNSKPGRAASNVQRLTVPREGRVVEVLTGDSTAIGVADATLSSAQPTTNLQRPDAASATSNRYWMQAGNSHPTYGDEHAVIGFDLSGIKQGVKVTDAQLELWQAGGSGADATFDLHALNRGFVEDETTWSQASSTIPWTAPGGDYESRPLASIGDVSALAKQLTFTDTSGSASPGSRPLLDKVQDWVDDPAVNHGFLLKAHDDTVSQQYIHLISSESPDPLFRPRLRVEHLVKNATETYEAPQMPQRFVPGTIITTPVKVTNTSDTTWPGSLQLSYRWTDPRSDTDITVSGDRRYVPLGRALEPGESVTLDLPIRAPINSDTGSKRLSYDLYLDLWTGTAWFSATNPPAPPLTERPAQGCAVGDTGLLCVDRYVENPTSDKLGLEKFYSYAAEETGAGSELLANLSSGNLVWSYDPISNPSLGPSAFVRLAYNSMDVTDAGAGYGVSVQPATLTRLGARLSVPSSANGSAPNLMTFIDGDGTTQTYKLDPDTATSTHVSYLRPAGVPVDLIWDRAAAHDKMWVFTRPDGTRFYYNQDTGLPTSVVDRLGNTLTFTHDSQGHLTNVTDAADRTVLELGYDATGLQWIRDVSGRALVFDYNAAHQLTSLSDGGPFDADTGAFRADATVRSFGFAYTDTSTNTNAKLKQVTDPRGAHTDVTYWTSTDDSTFAGWPRECTDRRGGVTTLAYADPDGSEATDIVATITDKNTIGASGGDSTTTYRMDGYGRTTSIKDANANASGAADVTKLGWDRDHNVIRLEEPNGAVSTWRYDRKTGYPLEIRDAQTNEENPSGTAGGAHGIRLDYVQLADVPGNPTVLTEEASAAGRSTTFTYDAAGNLQSVSNGLGYGPTYDYNPDGTLARATDANGGVTSFGDYDANGYPLSITDPATGKTDFVYDDGGNVLQVTDDKGTQTTAEYDPIGRPTKVTTPGDGSSDPTGARTAVTVYDLNDNVTAETAPNGAVTRYEYDPEDNDTKVTLPDNNTTERTLTAEYDAFGRLAKETAPEGVATAGDPDDFTTVYSYDHVGQLTAVDTPFADGSGVLSHVRTTYAYDNVGNRVLTIDPVKNLTSADDYTTRTTYDENHRPVAVTDAAGYTTKIEYDADGLVTGQIDQVGHKVATVYDAAAQPIEVHNPRNGVDLVTTYTYDKVGNLTRTTRPSGLYQETTYDAGNRPIQTKSAFSPGDPDYGSPANTFFRYDSLGRLARESDPTYAASDTDAGVSWTDFTYYPSGEIKSSTDPWAIKTNYTYNQLGQQLTRTLQGADDPAQRSLAWTYYPDGSLKSGSDHAAPSPAVVVDNSDLASTASTGTWGTVTDADQTNVVGTNYRTHATAAAGTTGANDTFTWKVTPDKAGTYDVYASCPARSDTTDAASYTINHSGGSSEATGDQRSCTSTATWQALGSYDFDGGSTKSIVLKTSPSGAVIADAIKLVQISPTPTTTLGYSYDRNGEQTQITSDAENTLSGFTPTDTINIDHDGLGRIKTVTELADEIEQRKTDYTYDLNSNPLTSYARQFAVGTNVAASRYTAYSWDSRNLVDTVKAGDTPTSNALDSWSYTYDPRGLGKTLTKPNGNVTTATYHDDGRTKTLVERRSADKGAGLVSSHTLTYTHDGDRSRDVAKIEHAGAADAFLDQTTAYAYTPAGKLAKATKSGADKGESESYTYDAAGNITTQTIGSAKTTMTYDRNRLITVKQGTGPAQRHHYDTFGRATTVEVQPSGGTAQILQRYAYDGFDHIIRNTTWDSTGTQQSRTIRYYDALDRTTLESVKTQANPAKNTKFIYLGLADQVAVEEKTDNAGNYKIAKTYTYGPQGQKLALVDTPVDASTTKTYYYGTNPHGDIETLTDAATGQATSTYRYTAYGAPDKTGTTGEDAITGDPVEDADVINPYRFSAKRIDPGSGDYDMGFRDYNPGINQYLTRDLYDGALADLALGTDPWNSNRYAFAGGNPISQVELDGHYAIDDNGTPYTNPPIPPSAIGDSNTNSSDTATGTAANTSKPTDGGPGPGSWEATPQWFQEAADSNDMSRKQFTFEYLQQTSPGSNPDEVSERQAIEDYYCAAFDASMCQGRGVVEGLLGITDAKQCVHGSATSCAWTAMVFFPIGKFPKAFEAVTRTAKAANGADNVVNGTRLGQQLARESADSVFTSSGRLSSGAIADSRQIIPGSRLGNKDLIQRLTSDGSDIADWGKYTTRTHQSPSGDFQVHFYMNRSTGAIDYGYDYKVIFNGAR